MQRVLVASRSQSVVALRRLASGSAPYLRRHQPALVALKGLVARPLSNVPAPPTEEVWVAVVDPHTGGTYYHNPFTDVTTHVGAPRPTWEPVVDATTNSIYWWNTETDETTPVGAACPVVVGQAQDGAPAQYAQQAGGVAQAAPAGGGGMMAGLGQTMAQGMAFGVGSAVAHQAIGSMMGGSSSESSSAPAEEHHDDGGGGDDDWA